MAGQCISCLLVNPGFTALRDESMSPLMVRIETTVRDSNSPADPFADPFSGGTGAPAKVGYRFSTGRQGFLEQHDAATGLATQRLDPGRPARVDICAVKICSVQSKKRVRDVLNCRFQCLGPLLAVSGVHVGWRMAEQIPFDICFDGRMPVGREHVAHT